MSFIGVAMDGILRKSEVDRDKTKQDWNSRRLWTNATAVAYFLLLLGYLISPIYFNIR